MIRNQASEPAAENVHSLCADKSGSTTGEMMKPFDTAAKTQMVLLDRNGVDWGVRPVFVCRKVK